MMFLLERYNREMSAFIAVHTLAWFLALSWFVWHAIEERSTEMLWRRIAICVVPVAWGAWLLSPISG